ncbi:MAG: tetratricopeptide repeat protein [Chitinophagaceae bacterium]
MQKIIILLLTCILSTHSYSQDAASYYKQGLEKAQAGKMEEAIELFSKTIELQPDDYYAWFNRGIARSRLNLYEAALTDFEQVIALSPEYKKAWLNRGIAKRHLTDYEGAIADYTYLVKMDPSYSDAFYNRGVVYEMLGKKDSACLDYNKAKDAGAANMDNKIAMCNNKSPLNTNTILRLTKTAPSDKYGFTQEDPVKAGTGPFGGPANQRAYLELLRDTKGNPVKYERLGSCCQYKSENGLMGYAMLDKYKITYTDADGNPATAVIYISFYDYEEPMILTGFKTISR